MALEENYSELFELMVESNRDYGIFMLDREGHVITWNTGAQSISGYAAHEIMGQHFSKFYTPEAVERSWPAQELEAATMRGRFEDESWRVRKDGSRYWANVVITALRDRAGVLRGFSKVVRDFSERKRELDGLKESELRHREMVQSVKDYAIFMLDAQGRVASWNAGAERIKGYRSAEIVGHHFSRFYPPEALERKWPERELAIASIQGRFEDEGWRVRKDGSRFWANVVITAIRNEDGKLTGFSKITRDLTERRRQEEALRQSEERFRLLIEGVRDYAILMLDPNGRVMSWNGGAEKLMGYRPVEVLGRDFAMFYTEDERRRAWPQRELEIARVEARFEEEGLRVRKNGTTFWANVVITALHDPEKSMRGYVKVIRDLTDRKRVESLEKAQQQTNEFLAMLAHELRNPLAPIMSSIDLLRSKPATDPETDTARQILHRQAQQLTRLVNDLLDVSRVTRAAIQVEKRPIQINCVVMQAADASRQWIEERRHTLELDVPKQTIWVQGDEQRLSQAVVNLLHNAAKYTPAGGRIELHLSQQNGEATIRVRDTGVGIAPELIEKVFDLFVQGERARDRSEGGLGLGLTLVKRLVALHGGTVEALSEGPGKGSEFVIRVPTISPPTGATRETQVEPAERNVKARHILVVDDNEDAAETLALILRTDGHTVRTALDGPGALQVLESFRPHITFIDIGMPGMNGYELAQRLRAMPAMRQTVLVALSGYGQPSDLAQSRSAGFDHHIVKPASLDEIRSVLMSNGIGAKNATKPPVPSS